MPTNLLRRDEILCILASRLIMDACVRNGRDRSIDRRFPNGATSWLAKSGIGVEARCATAWIIRQGYRVVALPYYQRSGKAAANVE